MSGWTPRASWKGNRHGVLARIKRASLRSQALLALLAAGALATALAAGEQADHHSPEFRSMQAKLASLKQNAAKPHPDPKPIGLTEREANAYFNEGGVKLPKGVSNVHLTSEPGVIDGHAQVDFEKIMEGKGSTNPLLSLFSGVHDVHIVAQAAGAAGTGTIRTQSAYLDGIEVPQVVLQYFAQHYITPKYPNVGVTSTFKLPLRIDSAIVEAGGVQLTQK
jgi:hypothetical protein